MDDLVLNHCTLLEPSVPPVTIPVTVILLFSLNSPIIFTFFTFGGAGIWQRQASQKQEVNNDFFFFGISNEILLNKKETPMYTEGVLREQYNQSFKLQCSSISSMLEQGRDLKATLQTN